MANVTPGLARSARPVMPWGLPFRTRMVSTLRAIGNASPTLPAEIGFTMSASSPATKTSAGAPSSTCCASVEDSPKVKFETTFARGFFFSKAWPSAVKTSVNDDGAKTLRSPLTSVLGKVVVVNSVRWAPPLLPPLRTPTRPVSSPSTLRL